MTRVLIALSAAACLGLAACDNRYIERKDTVTFGLGDAVTTNNAVMTANPWPRRSQNTRIPMDGVKAENALLRYRLGGASPGGPGPGAGGFAPGGAPPPPPLR